MFFVGAEYIKMFIIVNILCLQTMFQQYMRKQYLQLIAREYFF